MTGANDLLTLQQAVDQYKQEERAVSNSYEWYRRQAQKSGEVGIAGIHVPAVKLNGVWCVHRAHLSEAIDSHRESVRQRKQMTEDYRKGIIHGKDGDAIRTDFGGYEIHGDFRFVWDDVQRYRKKSYGIWYCGKCQAPAETEHNNPECHRCSDWRGCGTDCTLSKVYCRKCSSGLDI